MSELSCAVLCFECIQWRNSNRTSYRKNKAGDRNGRTPFESATQILVLKEVSVRTTQGHICIVMNTAILVLGTCWATLVVGCWHEGKTFICV